MAAVTRYEETAFRTLARLDPSPRPEMEETVVDRQIGRILADPRAGLIAAAGVGARPARAAPARRRPRYGAFGLVASAALAVAATLLWVSPSAGAPAGGGAGAPAQAVMAR
jgi:hypothetical protein